VLAGGAGDDRIFARKGGDDRIWCGPGTDSVEAGGRDRIRGCEEIAKS
jgi:hypothetical protein